MDVQYLYYQRLQCSFMFFSYRMLRSSTWSKDSHGLFDYESFNTTNAEFKIVGSSRIIRKGVTVGVKEASEDLEKTAGTEGKGLANIGFINNKYWVYNPIGYGDPNNQDQHLLLLRNCFSENNIPGIKLEIGDIFKLGRCKYVVKEIVQDAISTQEINIEINESNINEENKVILPAEECKENNDSEIKCRVCLDNTNTKDNPIIESPCKCAGYVKYIHAGCLEQWLKCNVTQKKNDKVASYVWDDFNCDICKEKYPSNVLYKLDQLKLPNGKPMHIFSIVRPAARYMLIESIKDSENKNKNDIYVISSDKNATLKII